MDTPVSLPRFVVSPTDADAGRSFAAEFGFLTLATRSDFPKAIALAFSLRISNPGIPIAVACHPDLRAWLAPVFDHVIDEAPGVRGFAHKVHLDRYSPFRRTMFFDSDVLVFRPVLDFVGDWPDSPYVACGRYSKSGFSPFGLDRKAVMSRLRKDSLVMIDGAGHALFTQPACTAVFDRAREITADYPAHGGDARYADEDVMSIVMTEMGLPPATDASFFSRYLTGRPGTVKLDAVGAHCSMISVDTGQIYQPCMMHFAANEAPLSYGLAMWRLYGVRARPRQRLLQATASDAWDWHVRRRLHEIRKRFSRST